METKTENTMGGGMEKKCTRCGRLLPIENFGTNAKWGVKSVCKECEHRARSAGRKGITKNPLAKFSKEELVAELQNRGLKIMASPTPREMMKRPYELGYDGDLKYIETKTITLSKLD